MNVLDLFSGIGGFSLGLERAGMRTVAFCECDPYCQRVLRKHWPDVPVFRDVRTLTAEALADPDCGGLLESVNAGKRAARMEQEQSARYQCIDVICGGFPCQDISVAGKGAGIEGSRSGLWSEFARIIGEVRPRYVIIENVANLLSGRSVVDGPDGPRVISWMGRILGDLAALGFDAEWHCIPASAVGAPHRRDRVWIVGIANSGGRSEREQASTTMGHGNPALATSGDATEVADADQPRLEGWLRRGLQECPGQWVARSDRPQWDEQGWFVESGMGRVFDGIRNRVDRLRALGNAIVPQVAEIIGRAIMQCEACRNG